ncbi:MAG: pyridoxal-phosphate dependent enzyme [Alphaproteobacteria bacterium]|nr:pyridoxal-phosphate dependent enzyme [Alphaproteobacteria bacterium]
MRQPRVRAVPRRGARRRRWPAVRVEELRGPVLPAGLLLTPLALAAPLAFREAEVDGVRLHVLDESGAGALYGGNKVRKLERILADARDRGHRDLITLGAIGSHHVIATALYARELGMRTHALLVAQPDTPHVRANAGRIAALCASYTAVPSRAELPVRGPEAWARIVAETGTTPYRIPAGGSSSLGTLGWVDVGQQLRAWCTARGIDCVVVAAGSGGTAAGLAAGLRGSGVEVVGVRVAPRVLINRARLGALAGGALPTIDGSWYCGGYGRYDARVERVVQASRDAGLVTETTYTGKSLGAALERARAGPRVLYVHTLSGVEPGESAPLPTDLEALLR